MTPPPVRVAFATLGCKTNQFESASMQQSLQAAGYRIVPFAAGAELVIVNTCTVTSATDAQSRNLVRRARRLNPACRVVVTGCYAQVDPAALSALPGVSLVIGNEEKQRLLAFLQQEGSASRVEVADIRQAGSVCLPPLTSFAGRSRAFVQIQNGCDAFCSYCIIPYARGASRSAHPDEVVSQVANLVEAGYAEIVLTGIHIGGYGADLAAPLSLSRLLRRLVAETGVHRLRLGSIEPTELSDELLAVMAASRVICPHLHIPLQAGDDHVLQRMGRSYDTRAFAALIQQARTMLPDAAICLDVITGFPGETAQEFTSTREFVAGLPITDLHVFPYSKRPGTPAATMPDQVPGPLRRERAEQLRRLAAQKKHRFATAFIGRELEVVVESGGKGDFFKGLSTNYLEVSFAGAAAPAGRCARVRVLACQDGVLQGELLP